ncbi:conjugal transfer protein [Enterococcus devriesei]|uniref:conjugal transfer protein n=1 Tax=Enterococcus devriesei TaxID=319970 RepID=UPI0036D33303
MILTPDMVRTDIPTKSTVESTQFWDIKPIDKNNFEVLFTVNQDITEQKKKQTTHSAYTLTIHVDDEENMVIIKNPTISSIPTKSKYKPKVSDNDGTVDAKTTEEIDSFLKTFFKLYPKANEKELSYYVNNQALKPINREYQFLELASSNYSLKNDQVVAQVSVTYLDPVTKANQTSQYNLTLQKEDNWMILN